MRIMKGLHNERQWYKMLEQNQLENMSSNASMEFIQQLEIIEKLNKSESWQKALEIANTYLLKDNKRQMPILWICRQEKGKQVASVWKDV